MFTKQDALTFILGALAGVLIEIKPLIDAALVPGAAIDTGALMQSIGTGALAALLRYLVTRTPELLVRVRS